MRRLIAVLALAMPIAAAADTPGLKALHDFPPGQWQQAAVGNRPVIGHCLADPALMLLGGVPGAECRFTVITDEDESATVTYRCAAGRSGHTRLRRDAQGLYSVQAQGLADGKPFVDKAEWRRSGAC